MRVIRVITYEGEPEDIRKQMKNSLRDGTYDYMTRITVKTVYSNHPTITGGRPEGWQRDIDA